MMYDISFGGKKRYASTRSICKLVDCCYGDLPIIFHFTSSIKKFHSVLSPLLERKISNLHLHNERLRVKVITRWKLSTKRGVLKVSSTLEEATIINLRIPHAGKLFFDDVVFRSPDCRLMIHIESGFA